MKPNLTDLVVLAGVSLVVAALWSWSPTLGLLGAGLALLGTGMIWALVNSTKRGR